MDPQTFKHFADNYTSADFDQIRLKDNGIYGEGFHDPNYLFRMHLAEYLKSDLGSVKLELIRDLYLEIARSSEFTFGVYTSFHLFAQELLERGGKNYLLDYIRGASYSMDTGMSSGRIALSKDRARELVSYFEERKATAIDPEEQRLLNDFIHQRLLRQLNR